MQYIHAIANSIKSKSASGKTQWKANQISFWPFPLSSLETEADLYERRISTRCKPAPFSFLRRRWHTVVPLLLPLPSSPFGEHVWLWKISRRVELEFWILIPSCSVRHAGRIVNLENVVPIRTPRIVKGNNPLSLVWFKWGSQWWGILKHFPQSRCILISHWSREKKQSSFII